MNCHDSRKSYRVLFFVRNRLQNEVTNKQDLIEHYEKQITLLEKQISARGEKIDLNECLYLI